MAVDKWVLGVRKHPQILLALLVVTVKVLHYRCLLRLNNQLWYGEKHSQTLKLVYALVNYVKSPLNLSAVLCSVAAPFNMKLLAYVRSMQKITALKLH